MLISVVICTFNRAESLRRALNSVVAMDVPGDLAWELIIVNNNCTDHTDEVIGAYRNRLPLRREFEPIPGHCRARNRAIEAATGEYIVWTDDDVVVDPGWIRAYSEAFRRCPEAAVFGGRIIPTFENPVVEWVIETEAMVGGAYARRDLGEKIQPLRINSDLIPYGANFAVRTKEQRVFRYDPELGLAPGRRRYYDEVDVIERILKCGILGYWIPQAVVNHCIGREKQTSKYLIDYFTALGESEAYQRSAAAVFPRKVWPVKRWLRYRLHRLVSPPSIWVMHLQSYAHAKGTFRYWRQRSL